MSYNRHWGNILSNETFPSCFFFFSIKKQLRPSMIWHACNLSTGETEAEGSTDQGQPGIHSKILAQQKKEKGSN
jgi:hypothetical protein